MTRRHPPSASAARRGRGRGRGQHPVASVTLLFFAIVAALVSAADDKRPNEHVVLADCRSADTNFSSQVAYFNGPPSNKPQDVAPVVTVPGEARVWPGNTTKAFFTTTGTSFTATLGPQVDLGAFAGTGFNDYTNFTCWRRYQANLYKYDGHICAMAYDCTHEPAPSATNSSGDPSGSGGAPNPNGSGSQTLPQGTPINDGQSDELSLGAIIGVTVGAVAGALMVGGLVAFVVVHKRRWRRQDEELQRQLEGISLMTPTAATSPTLVQTTIGVEGKSNQPSVDGSPRPGPPPSLSPRPQHEMDNQWRGAEVPGAAVARELDGFYVVPELDARGRPVSTAPTGPGT